MKKVLSCILVLAIFLSLSMAGWTGAALAEDDESIVGFWLSTIELRDYLAMEEPELGAYLTTAPVTVAMDIREDGTYTLSLDAAPAMPGIKTALYAYIEALCEQNGLTIAQFEEAAEQSVEDLIEEAMEEFDLSEINQTIEGSWEEKDGEVIWDKDANQTRGTYTGKTLSFELPDFGEIVFTRASLVGLWIGKVNFIEFMGSEVDSEELELFKDVSMDLILDVRSDGTFALSVDGASMFPAMKLAMMQYMEQMLEENGMSIETLEAATGQTLEEMIDEAMVDMDVDELAEAISGTWEDEDGTFTLKVEDGNDQQGTWSGNTLKISVEEYGELEFNRTSNEDVLAKSEGVMSYDEYIAAESDAEVVIEAYLQAKQAYNAEYKNTSLYLQDGKGGYFVYRIGCTQEEYDSMIVGRKLKITGYKSEWSGEIEITDASFELENGSYTARALDVSALLGTDELAAKQNQLISVKGATVAESAGGAAFLYGWDGSGEDGSDLYFNVTMDGETYTFVVESDLCGPGTGVYETVKNLNVGDTINLTGYLYWYEGPQPHVISVVVK